jgi:thiol:disulfide interchange protein DsbD
MKALSGMQCMIGRKTQVILLTLTAMWTAFTLRAVALGQGKTPSVLEQLETNEGATGGKVELDIRPSEVIHWTLSGHELDPNSGKLNATVVLSTERQFTIYEDKLKIEISDGWTLTTKTAPPTTMQFDPISRKEVSVYTGGPFNLSFQATGSPVDAVIKFTYVGCTQVICLFPHTEKITVPFSSTQLNKAQNQDSEGSKTPAETSSAKPDSSSATVTATQTSASEGQSIEEQLSQRVKSGSMGLAMLLLIAFVGGLLTNLTPCVAPMIPITIRLLAHQTTRPLTSSIMYALGIVATYTLLGLVAALSGALFGNLIAHPAVSITFGFVMFLLGMSMLGFGDFSKLQQIGGQIGSSKGGAFNALLMGAGAGLVASPCTGPILAALLTYTAGRQNAIEAAALLGTYSVGFALPYVFLGASAAKLSKMRVNFQVQILTKLVFASVMFGLSLYFLRIPLYGLFTTLKPYWGSIGVIGVIAGLALSALVILRPSLHHRKAVFLAPTLSLGIGVFFGIQALTRSTTSNANAITWYHTEKEAIEAAGKSGKPILVDAWAEWCEACKKMDATTFVDPEVISEVSQNWIALKFDLTEINDENDAIQQRYELPGLPTLTLLPSSGDLSKKQAITGYTGAASLLEQLKKFNTTKAGSQ